MAEYPLAGPDDDDEADDANAVDIGTVAPKQSPLSEQTNEPAYGVDPAHQQKIINLGAAMLGAGQRGSAGINRQLEDATAGLLRKLQPPEDQINIPMLSAASALLAPTRTGRFTESLSAAGPALINPLMQQRKEEQQRQILGQQAAIQAARARQAEFLKQQEMGTRLLVAGSRQGPQQRVDPLSGIERQLRAEGLSPGTPAYQDRARELYKTTLEAKGAQAKATTLSPFGRIAQDKGLVPGTPEYAEDVKTQQKAAADLKAKEPKPPVELTEGQKVVGKKYGEMYIAMQDSALSAPAKLARFERLGELLDKTYTGVGGDTAQALNRGYKAIGDQFGWNTTAITEKVGSAEAAQALAKEMALEFRNPAGGAGMPGALSDSDRQFLERMVGSDLSTTPAGRRKILDIRRKLIEREIAVAKMAREYRKRVGKFDEGFTDELEEFSAKNPLFAGPAPAAGGDDVLGLGLTRKVAKP